MSYEWPLAPEDLFAERYPQMRWTGVTAAEIHGVRAKITEMWPDAPGGWVYEWSRLAARHAAAGRHDRAAAAYGWAKFPSLADEAKHEALAGQLEQYLLAATGFGVEFLRVAMPTEYLDGAVSVPVHGFAPPDLPAGSPVLLVCGGLDIGKMDLHPLLVHLATQVRARVLAFDIPGGGESEVPMGSGAGCQLVDSVVEAARWFGGRLGILGVSFGGYHAARAGLAGAVEAAVVLGGPVERAFVEESVARFAPTDLVDNAFGLDEPATDTDRTDRWREFSLRPLLDKDDNAPMLVLNGAADTRVPWHDTLVFAERRAGTAALIPAAGHAALDALPRVLPEVTGWLTEQLYP